MSSSGDAAYKGDKRKCWQACEKLIIVVGAAGGAKAHLKQFLPLQQLLSSNKVS